VGFHEVRFSDAISYGTSGGPGFSTSIIVTDSGAEERIPHWESARRRYDVKWAIKSRDELREVAEFYIRRLGPAYGFRYKDWLDYASTAEGRVSDDEGIAVTAFDQLLRTGDGSLTQFQLVKRYQDLLVDRVRTITKPVQGTVRVGIDGVEQTSGWSVNTTTGIITFTTAPGGNLDVTAGYEFDVPVRFGKEVDLSLGMSHEAFDIGQIPNIPLVEIRDEVAQSEEFFFGGAAYITLSADRTISLNDGRVLHVTPSANGYALLLPSNPTSLPGGGPYWYIHNASDSYTFEIRDHEDTLISLVGLGKTVEIVLARYTTLFKWLAI